MRISHGRVVRLEKDHEQFHTAFGTDCQGPNDCYYLQGKIMFVREPMCTKGEAEERLVAFIIDVSKKGVILSGISAHPLVCELLRDVCMREHLTLTADPDIPTADIRVQGRQLNNLSKYEQ